MEKIKNYIENDDAELDDAIREVPWYETALDFVAGVGVEFGKNTLEGVAFIPFAIVDGIFGANLNNRLSNNLDNLEELYVLPHIGNKTAYYYGRATGDVITMIVGAYGLAAGVLTIAGGITFTAGGAAVSDTGVGSIVGGLAIAISVPVVLAGTAELALSGAVFAEGYNNINDNIKKASTDEVSEFSSSKQSRVENNLKSNSFKDKINNIDDNILSDMESRGGHTIDRHVGKDEQYLINRVNGMKSKNAAATSFKDSETATKALKDTLTKNADDIEDWLNNSNDARKVIETNFNYEVGYVVSKSTGQMVEGLKKSVTVIVRDPTSPLGFYVLTTYSSMK